MNKKLSSVLATITMAILPVAAMAQESPGSYGWTSIRSFVINAIYTIGGLIVVGALLISGIMFATAGGDDEKLKTARTALIWAVAAVVILVVAASIWTIITSWIS